MLISVFCKKKRNKWYCLFLTNGELVVRSRGSASRSARGWLFKGSYSALSCRRADFPEARSTNSCERAQARFEARELGRVVARHRAGSNARHQARGRGGQDPAGPRIEQICAVRRVSFGCRNPSWGGEEAWAPSAGFHAPNARGEGHRLRGQACDGAPHGIVRAGPRLVQVRAGTGAPSARTLQGAAPRNPENGKFRLENLMGGPPRFESKS